MKLSNFEITKDFITLRQGETDYDLHNNFDFNSFHYDLSQRTIKLNWKKRKSKWTPNDTPEKLQLVLKEVYLFRARERDPELPFTEDDCLSHIGFLSNELLDEMDGFCNNEPEDGTHLSIGFMSGLALKIDAKLAILNVDRST